MDSKRMHYLLFKINLILFYLNDELFDSNKGQIAHNIIILRYENFLLFCGECEYFFVIYTIKINHNRLLESEK